MSELKPGKLKSNTGMFDVSRRCHVNIWVHARAYSLKTRAFPYNVMHTRGCNPLDVVASRKVKYVNIFIYKKHNTIK